jgi:hypothetical protein
MRARKHFRPDTFPFLAVLLCAMGSLILLLLIMDRRAKAVARARAMQMVTRATAEEEQANAARQAEWERRRQALHASLLQQEEEVRLRIGSTQGQVTTAAARVREEEAHQGELRVALLAEQARLTASVHDLEGHRARLAQAERQTEVARAELAVLTGSLQQLERTLAELKAARQREQHTYSVVPYHGKRGDNRRPLYVECTATGLVFHPDRKTLAGPDFTPGAVRTEVEQRIAQQRAAQGPEGTAPEQQAYLLFLVRPEGIINYYQTLTVVRGLQVDFGYEFIDSDWLLDFPADESTPARQPWMTVDKTPIVQPAPAAEPGRAPRGVASGPGEASPGAAAGTRNAQLRGPGTGLAKGVGGPTTTGPAAGRGLPGAGENSGASAVTGHGVLAGSGPSATSPSNPLASGNGSGSGGVGTQPSDAGGVSPRRVGVNNSAVAGTGGGQPSGPSRGTRGPDAEFGNPSVGDGVSGSAWAAQEQPAGGGANSRGALTFDGAAGREGEAASDHAAASPSPGSGSAPGSRTPAGSGVAGTPGAGGDPERATGSRQLNVGPRIDTGDRQPQPPRLRLVGNRDWVLLIECTADALVLYPGGKRFPVQSLAAQSAGASALVQAVQAMIVHRQAMVRSGEPPYRPQIRFLVRPDGLRTFYQGYPLLETVQVPMTRQNLSEDEEIK